MNKRGLLLALILLAPCIGGAGATAGDSATVALAAPSMAVTGRSVTVTVNVSGLEHFNAANYSIGYDPALFELDMVAPGSVDETTIPVSFNNQDGTLRLVNTLNDSTASGSGYLARITFSCIGTGTAGLSVQGNLSAVHDGQQQELSASWTGTTITVTPTVLAVEAPQSASDTFTASLVLSNVSTLDSFNLNLSYDAHRLGVQSYGNGSIGGTLVQVAGAVRNDIGVLTLVGTTPSGAANGSGILANVTFAPKQNQSVAAIAIANATFAAGDGDGSIIPVYREGTSVVLTSETDVPPVASFSWQPGTPVSGETVVFSAAGSDDPDGWLTGYTWSIEGSTLYGEQVSHHFAGPGTYEVSLTVTDNDGLSNTSSGTVEVDNAPPVAAFSLSPEQPVAGQAVSFTDGSSDPDGSIAAWQWTFGDGAISSEANPSHTYSEDGTYEVTLTVTDDDGATNSSSQHLTVAANEPPEQPTGPSPADGATGLSTDVTLEARVSDPDGDAMTVTFYNDATGSVIDTDTDVASDGTASVTWSSLSYSTTYRWYAVADDGVTDGPASSTWSFTTGQAPPPPPPPEPQPPSADFSYSADGRTVSFTDESSDPDGSIAAYTWSFGDGTSSTQASPVHTYTTDDTYTVTLAVTDSDGMTDETSMAVQVAAPEPKRPDLAVTDIVMSPASPVAGDTVQFTITVANTGTANASAVPLDIYLDGEWITSIQLPSIETGASTNRTQAVNATAESHTIKAVVDPDNEVQEANEDNNEETMPFSVAGGDEGDAGGQVPWLMVAVAIAVIGGAAVAAFVIYKRRMQT